MKLELTNYTADAIRTAAKANGIKDAKLDKAQSASFLPSEGTFTSLEFGGEEKANVNGEEVDTRHMRVTFETEKGIKGSISLSSLQASGFVGNEPQTAIVQSQKGKFYLKPNTTPNRWALGDQAILAETILGKDFKATPIQVNVSTFEAKKSDVKISAKTLYAIELL